MHGSRYSPMLLAAALTSVAASLALVACGDDKTGITGQGAPTVEAREGDQILPRTATLVVPDGGARRVTLGNTGDADLVIKGASLEATPAGAFTLSAPVMPSEGTPFVVAPNGTPWELSVAFDASKVPEGTRAKATITVRTNTTLPDGLDTFVFYAQPETIVSKLLVQPSVVDFARVEPNTTTIKPLNILNTGAATLRILSVELRGEPGYSAAVAGTTVTSGLVTLATPLELPAGTARQVDVTFASQGQQPAEAELVFYSDDPAAPSGTSARLFANLVGPCLRAIPQTVDFGAKQVGQASTIALEIHSCGDREVEVTGVTLVDDGGGLFSIDTSALTLPLRLPAGARQTIPVTYFPEAFAALGSDGQYVRDRGRLRIASNAYFEAVEVELSGFGSSCCCPLAVIDVPQGDEVIAQTELTLSALSSSSPAGEITAWKWSVIQPSGSVSQFFPSAEVREPTFVPNVVGTYIFRLEVFDATGAKSCAPAEYTVEVASDDAIHVELLWRTPGDIDETDEGGGPNFSWGSDVDLHFLYPFAVRYFDDSFDCYWLNPQLEWLPAGPDGNPRLDRDDRDGGGPENLNMKVPESGSSYRVGVHYYNDWGYGNALATVRIYIYGVLREQWNEVEISNAQLWESHTIEWPSGKITRVLEDGAPKIISGYPTSL